jgi:hypothetical protein
VVLHRAASQPKADLWAGASRSVLRDLEIACWWSVDVGEFPEGWLVAVDYDPGRA